MTPQPEKLEVPPLRSGGIMLGYQCNQTCRHCNYRSGPGIGEWMSPATLHHVLDRLAGERHLVEVHLAGGEATLNPELLERTIRAALARRIRLSYLETNGFYADSVAAAKKVLAPLKRAGLGSVLVSVSPYHNEYIPLRHTLNCLEAAEEIFGGEGVFPWLGHFIPMLARLDPDQPHSLEEFLAANGLQPGDPELLSLFPLIPGGRVPERLRPFFRAHPAETFRHGHCLETLTDVSHFHIDSGGRLFTGQCPGIAAGLADQPEGWHGEKTMERHPGFVALACGGPWALVEIARSECGFTPRPEGYVSPCELCYQARKSLAAHDPVEWHEFGPDIYYTVRGMEA